MKEKGRGLSKLVFVFAAKNGKFTKNVSKNYPQGVDE
jgi:hypothetical protein